jgi:hypothetical protein
MICTVAVLGLGLAFLGVFVIGFVLGGILMTSFG